MNVIRKVPDSTTAALSGGAASILKSQSKHLTLVLTTPKLVKMAGVIVGATVLCFISRVSDVQRFSDSAVRAAKTLVGESRQTFYYSKNTKKRSDKLVLLCKSLAALETAASVTSVNYIETKFPSIRYDQQVAKLTQMINNLQSNQMSNSRRVIEPQSQSQRNTNASVNNSSYSNIKSNNGMPILTNQRRHVLTTTTQNKSPRMMGNKQRNIIHSNGINTPFHVNSNVNNRYYNR